MNCKFNIGDTFYYVKRITEADECECCGSQIGRRVVGYEVSGYKIDTITIIDATLGDGVLLGLGGTRLRPITELDCDSLWYSVEKDALKKATQLNTAINQAAKAK